MANYLLIRRMFFLICSTVFFYSSFQTQLIAQTKVHGSVIDFNGRPLPNANVLLLKAHDSSLVKGVMTSTDGNFIIESVPAGYYVVASTYIGYKQVYTSKFQVE